MTTTNAMEGEDIGGLTRRHFLGLGLVAGIAAVAGGAVFASRYFENEKEPRQAIVEPFNINEPDTKENRDLQRNEVQTYFKKGLAYLQERYGVDPNEMNLVGFHHVDWHADSESVHTGDVGYFMLIRGPNFHASLVGFYDKTEEEMFTGKSDYSRIKIDEQSTFRIQNRAHKQLINILDAEMLHGPCPQIPYVVTAVMPAIKEDMTEKELEKIEQTGGNQLYRVQIKTFNSPDNLVTKFDEIRYVDLSSKTIIAKQDSERNFRIQEQGTCKVRLGLSTGFAQTKFDFSRGIPIKEHTNYLK